MLNGQLQIATSPGALVVCFESGTMGDGLPLPPSNSQVKSTAVESWPLGKRYHRL